ncbi:MAG: hypothetical protein M3R00_00285 [Pseudomonadota bacterium]|nr:hypothetical protein [Pseudomonadota bacterium]
MSEDNYDIGNDFEADFDVDEDIVEEAAKPKVVPQKPKRNGRQRLQDLLEAQRLRADLVGFDESLLENGSFYDDDIFTELYK